MDPAPTLHRASAFNEVFAASENRSSRLGSRAMLCSLELGPAQALWSAFLVQRCPAHLFIFDEVKQGGVESPATGIDPKETYTPTAYFLSEIAGRGGRFRRNGDERGLVSGRETLVLKGHKKVKNRKAQAQALRTGKQTEGK